MARKRVRDEWQERIRAVEREYLAARKAVDDFIQALNRGTTKLPPNTKLRDVNAMSDNLEGTYLIRLFAAFESGLRSFWRTVKPDTIPGRGELDRRGRGPAVDPRRHAGRRPRGAAVPE
jgi:hypothetical protein